MNSHFNTQKNPERLFSSGDTVYTYDDKGKKSIGILIYSPEFNQWHIQYIDGRTCIVLDFSTIFKEKIIKINL